MARLKTAPRQVKAAVTKAYGVLADRPLSVLEVSPDQRKDIIISAVIDANGKTLVLSRLGDIVWKLWPFFAQSNVAPARMEIQWTRIPEVFREVCQAVTYRYWRFGIPGWQPPKAATLCKFVQDLVTFTNYIHGLGIRSMADVRPIHVANYVHEQKMVKQMRPGTLQHSFSVIETLHRFADQHPDGLSIHPWPESSALEMAGLVGQSAKQARRVGKTPLIPQVVAQTLFVFADDVLMGADAVLDERDAGLRSNYKDPEVTIIRNACFYQLGTLTGMRCEELVGVEIGAGRTEIIDGITYHWARSIEHKTGKGQVEYLMPSMGHEILRILERWSGPLRLVLRAQLAEWQSDTGKKGRAERLRRIARARADQNRLFLGRRAQGISALSGDACRDIMKKFATRAGVKWNLAPHQMRKLYAWTFVRHRLGNLLFLKEQFKHSTLDMTQLYTANPLQDAALYDEILEELRNQKVEVVQGWLHDDELLAGGAGKKIMKLRAHDFINRKAMIEETADKLNIRSTGHSWCLAQDEGCGGAGLYERTRCGAGCRNGVIDSTFKSVWQEIYRHQRELLVEAQDLGPGAAERVRRDLERAEAVLNDLGVEIAEEVPDAFTGN
jgi:site-specific recombinase XerD